MIATIYGPMDEATLTRRESVEHGVRVVSYYLADELVHRSAAVGLMGLALIGRTA
jgi:hypothetical protein